MHHFLGRPGDESSNESTSLANGPVCVFLCPAIESFNAIDGTEIDRKPVTFMSLSPKIRLLTYKLVLPTQDKLINRSAEEVESDPNGLSELCFEAPEAFVFDVDLRLRATHSMKKTLRILRPPQL